MTVLLLIVLTFALGLTSARLLTDRTHQRELLQWLAEGGEHALPDGSGRWRDIFTAMQKLRKARLSEVMALEQRLTRYFNAAAVLPDGVILLDSSDHIEWVNASAAKHFGIDMQRDLGTLITQLVRQPVFYDFLTRFHVGDVPPEASVTVITGDRHLQMHLLRFSDQGTLLLTRDVSLALRTEKMRRDFVANVSHELRTPVTVIGGFLEQLTSDDPPDRKDSQRFLAMMRDQAERMRRLIEDLLTLSRLENDERAPSQTEVNVPALIEDLLEEARALSAGRHTIDVAEVCEVHVTGNKDELRSAFGNLVSNAIRYTPEGGKIQLSWHLLVSGPAFSVTDSGIGIAPEHIPRLTERFYRVDRGRSTASGGTGLGLAIVKHALARHQGKLHIQSTLGRGSTFSARLPAARVIAP